MNSMQSATLDAGTGWLILAVFSIIWIALGGYLGRRAFELGLRRLR